MQTNDAWQIEIVPRTQYPELLAILEQQSPGHPVTQLLRGQVDHELEAWTTVRSGQRHSVAAVQWHPGATASLTGPWTKAEEPARLLVQAVVAEARKRGNSLVQSLTELDTGQDVEILQHAGFEHIADLLYLVSFSSAFPDTEPVSRLRFEPYDESQRQRLLTMIEQTYEATQDCPSLNAAREMSDVLEGYRSTGVFEPALWSNATSDAQDVGCLLLAAHPLFNNLEIVYLGVAPGFRGHGFGLEMVRHAQWIAAARGFERVVLAVDAANEPALRTYAQAGFVGWDRRSVWVRLLDRKE